MHQRPARLAITAALGAVWLAAQTVPELPVEATDSAALGDGERRSVSADPREPIGHHFVRFQGKGATALVERAVLTRVGNIEEGESGLELGEQKPPADLVEAVPELRRYLELIRMVRHRMGLNEGAGKELVSSSRRVARAAAPERRCMRQAIPKERGHTMWWSVIGECP